MSLPLHLQAMIASLRVEFAYERDFWSPSGGGQILFTDMKTSHLTNSILLLERRALEMSMTYNTTITPEECFPVILKMRREMASRLGEPAHIDASRPTRLQVKEQARRSWQVRERARRDPDYGPDYEADYWNRKDY
jgi:hypothetical protein